MRLSRSLSPSLPLSLSPSPFTHSARAATEYAAKAAISELDMRSLAIDTALDATEAREAEIEARANRAVAQIEAATRRWLKQVRWRC